VDFDPTEELTALCEAVPRLAKGKVLPRPREIDERASQVQLNIIAARGVLDRHLWWG